MENPLRDFGALHELADGLLLPDDLAGRIGMMIDAGLAASNRTLESGNSNAGPGRVAGGNT